MDGRAERYTQECVALRLGKTGPVRAAAHRGIAKLNVVVFPTADRADVIRARTLAKDEEPAGGAWEEVVR